MTISFDITKNECIFRSFKDKEGDKDKNRISN